MGCNSSTVVVVANAVDMQLIEAQEQEKYNHKILLLGAGESGKSTVVKQIKMIWKVGGGPSEKEKQEYILAIRRNCIEAIHTLLEASKNLDVPLENKELTPTFEKLSGMHTDTTVTPEIGSDINALWRDPGIQRVYERREEFWNMDATGTLVDTSCLSPSAEPCIDFALSYPSPLLPLHPSILSQRSPAVG